MYATTLSESDSSNYDSEESCDEEGNYSAFMTIAHVKSSDTLNLLVQELGEHSDEESLGVVEELDAEEDERTSHETLLELSCFLTPYPFLHHLLLFHFILSICEDGDASLMFHDDYPSKKFSHIIDK